MCTRYLSRGVALITHLSSSAKVEYRYSYSSTPPLCLFGMQQGSLHFYMYVFICLFVLCGYNHVSTHMTGHVFTLRYIEIFH